MTRFALPIFAIALFIAPWSANGQGPKPANILSATSPAAGATFHNGSSITCTSTIVVTSSTYSSLIFGSSGVKNVLIFTNTGTYTGNMLPHLYWSAGTGTVTNAGGCLLSGAPDNSASPAYYKINYTCSFQPQNLTAANGTIPVVIGYVITDYLGNPLAYWGSQQFNITQ